MVSGTIAKLRNINAKTDFISKLSDKSGLPEWNYLTRAKNKTANRGDESSEMLIIPLKVVDGFLSSLMYVENPDSETPQVYTITNDQLDVFTHNSSIDREIRESILMTFIFFDNEMFGSRLY